MNWIPRTAVDSAGEVAARAQLLQMLYTIRSERLLMEEMDYNLLFRWFVGLNADDEVWDPEAELARKGPGKESRLSYSGNLLVENRNGLIVAAEVFHANGTAERDAALVMLEKLPGTQRVTVRRTL